MRIAWRRAPENPRAGRDKRPKALPVALREIVGNLTLTEREVLAWYRLAPVPWQFRSDAARDGVLDQLSLGYSALAGRALHLRVTERPYPAHVWARSLSEYVRDGEARTPGATPTDEVAFAERVKDAQRHLRRTRSSETETYLGVPIGGRRAVDRLSAATLGRGRSRGAEHVRLAAELREVDESVRQLGGSAASFADLEWLVHRSVGLGLPEPRYLSPALDDDGMDATDLYGFTDSVDIHPSPFGRALRVVGHPHRFGEDVARHVSVMSIGRMEHLDIPGRHEPWVAVSQRLPFPVEWSIRVEVIAGVDAQSEMKRKLELVRDQRLQYQAHGLEEPPELERVAARARAIRDEMETGTESVSTRTRVWARAAVAGRDEKEVAERVRAFSRLYRDLHITVEHPRAQVALMAEFRPGERRATVAHRRSQPVRFFAAAIPQTASMLGDRRGWYRGYTCGTTRRAVMWDPWFAMLVREKSGLTPVLGGLGSGKSVLMGAVAYDAALAGIHTTVLDPSGPLARLCAMPEMAGRARHIDLLGARQGTLSPYAIVAVPRREQFADDDRAREAPRGVVRDRVVEELYREATVLAEATRKMLATDVVHMLLPPAVLERPETSLAVANAVRAAGGVVSTSMWSVVEQLEREGGYAATLAAYLRDMSELPLSRLFFQGGATENGGGVAVPDAIEETLLVLTMAGLVQPDLDLDRRDWSVEERIAVPLLHLGAHYASRRVYGQRMNVRKLVCVDEAHYLSKWPSGKALFSRWNRDTRKWRTRVMAATQKSGDLLGQNVAGLVEEVFVGRMEDYADARGALELLRVQTDVGYEQVLAGLSPRLLGTARTGYREFVFRDVDGNVDKLRIDLDHNPDLLAALDPNTVPEPSAAPAAEAVADPGAGEVGELLGVPG